MAKQIIEIEVPDGMKAIWKHNKICYESINPIERIKTVRDAIDYLTENNMCPELLLELSETICGTYSRTLCEYRVVVAALTNNEKRYLTTGKCWFPIVQFCHSGDVKNCLGKEILGHIESGGNKYVVVGGNAYDGLSSGLGHFAVVDGVSLSFAQVGFQPVSSKEIAQYISKQFGRLLFDLQYGGTNCNWYWID